ncbi:metallophosphoesterase [Facklamia sp. DSM 111018]|uniref:Metallophosphoesterase n=1 Tax=Facklamia lactis TaxID=2749967 RepID=A0ABS0LNV9_9LACT|nr:metallophosphoesterase [Facklamia lactis]MBG9979586.1 metallophosphoesterase [Facklamia lactis]MBG9985734.1 metallophosphoesterase [Facklamia lactis]
MKFLHLSDTHFSLEYKDPELKMTLMAQRPLTEKLDIILQQENLPSIDFIIVTGDLVHDGVAEEYQKLNELLRDKFQNKTIYYTLGNHDDKQAFYEGIYSEAKSDCLDYDQVLDGFHFIFLDSSKPYSHSGILEDHQIEWLKACLAKNDHPKLIFMHHPVIGGHYFDQFTFEEPLPFLETLKPYDVRGVFTGHTHSPAVNFYHQVCQYTNYAMAFGLEKMSDYSQAFSNVNGYTMVEYTEASGLTIAPRMIQPDYQIYKITDPVQMSDLNKSYEK